jgi:lipoprotein-releasing system permease protein
MNKTPFSIKRLLSNVKENGKFRFSIVFINKLSISLCIATILLASFFIKGFEYEIEAKIINFWSNIHIIPYSMAYNFNENPISISNQDLQIIQNHSNVKSIHRTAHKGVLIKNNDNIEGLILKGIDKNGINKLNKIVIKSISNNKIDSNDIPVFISKSMLEKLDTKLGNSIYLSFLAENHITKKGYIKGIFSSGIIEFDDQHIFTDLKMVQDLNQWPEDSISSVEISLFDKNKIQQTINDLSTISPDIHFTSIYELFPQLFDWLKLMSQNETIIFIIMMLVAMINIVNTISIYILERARTIGLLKVLGASNRWLYKIFFIQLSKTILTGAIWGNGIAFIIAYIQLNWHPINLDPATYYLDKAPIYIDWISVIFINLISILVSYFTLLIPMIWLTKISPIKVTEYN